MMEGDIGPHPRQWGGHELQIGGNQFFYFREGDPPPHFDPCAEGYVGQHKGFMRVLYERGKYTEGMTACGDKDNYIPENPDACQSHDLVIRDEPVGDGDETNQFLYRVLTVPGDHIDVESTDGIECELMKVKQWKGAEVYMPSGQKWGFSI